MVHHVRKSPKNVSFYKNASEASLNKSESFVASIMNFMNGLVKRDFLSNFSNTMQGYTMDY